jgi:hypothetical protein
MKSACRSGSRVRAAHLALGSSVRPGCRRCSWSLSGDGARDRHYANGVLRIYRLGQPWLVLEGGDHYVAIDLAAEVRAFARS